VLIAGSEESYCVCVFFFLIVCDLETSKRGGLGLTSAVASSLFSVDFVLETYCLRTTYLGRNVG
jgi:hypothetical protein